MVAKDEEGREECRLRNICFVHCPGPEESLVASEMQPWEADSVGIAELTCYRQRWSSLWLETREMGTINRREVKELRGIFFYLGLHLKTLGPKGRQGDF